MKIEKILQMSKERIGYKLYQSKLNILKWSLGGFIMGVLALSIMFTSHHALAFISCMTLGICSFVGSIVCGVESITDWNKFKNNRIFSIFDSEKSLIVLSSEEIQELF
jgi:hypothetical protein